MQKHLRLNTYYIYLVTTIKYSLLTTICRSTMVCMKLLYLILNYHNNTLINNLHQKEDSFT